MDEKTRRLLLRRAEQAADDPEALKALEADGLTVGDWQPVDKAELLAELERENPNEKPSIEVTVYLDDTTGTREHIEDFLADFVAEQGIGRWVGSGQGTWGERPFFDVAFEVADLLVALPLIQAKLKELGAGPSTQVSASDGTTHSL